MDLRGLNGVVMCVEDVAVARLKSRIQAKDMTVMCL
jgi:hypothetical protein